MLYTEKEKHEIERVKEVFAEHLRQSPDFELLWSDKVAMSGWRLASIQSMWIPVSESNQPPISAAGVWMMLLRMFCI